VITTLLVGAALAAQPGYPHPVVLVGGVSALAGGANAAFGAPSFGGGVEGRLIITGRARWALEMGARELFATADPRSMGAIFAGPRWAGPALGPGQLFLRGGFAHNHEIALAEAEADPLAALLGTHEAIRHRTGLELGGAWWLPLEEAILRDRLGLNFDLGGAVFADAQGPRVYAYAGVDLTIGAGAPR